MTWSRFDDGYDEHDKVEEAWDDDRATIGLHVQATTACNRWLSDGVIKPRWLNGKLPERKERTRVLAAMVTHGLFDVLTAGEIRSLIDSDGNVIEVGPYSEDRYIVHDFLDRHDSSVQTKARRQADADRKRAGRRKDSVVSPSGVRADASRTPNGHRADSVKSPLTGGREGGRPRPDPTRPDQDTPQPPQAGEWSTPPIRPGTGRKRDEDRYAADVASYAAWVAPSIDDPERTHLVSMALGHLNGAPGRQRTNDNVRTLVRNVVEYGTPFPKTEVVA